MVLDHPGLTRKDQRRLRYGSIGIRRPQRSRPSPQEIFESIWKSSPVLRDRLDSAELVGNIQVTSDFSYYNKRYVGKRLLRVGDAAGFMDPIFSAGVFLAMYSGRMAANVIIDLLANGERGRESRMAKYENR